MEEKINSPKVKRSLSKVILDNFSIKQFVWLFLSLIFLLGGLIILVFGLIGDYAPSNIGKTFSTASLAISAAFHFGLTLTWLGVFFLLLGGLIFAIVLSISSKTDDRAKEREARRSQRRRALSSADDKIVIDANVVNASLVNDNKETK